MKILFLISTLKYGKGGHYHSLKALIDSLGHNIEPFIINIGINNSPVIDSINVPKKMIYINVLNFSKVITEINSFTQSNKIDIIHSYDEFAHLYARVVSNMKEVPVILTKCGGPNPTYYFPYAKNLILFSQENIDYFKSENKFNNSNIELISNRTLDFPTNIKYINDLKLKLLEYKEHTVFLRITRITEEYENGLRQSINLINRLNKKGHQVILLVVGSIYSETLYENLIQTGNSKIVFVTEDKYTKNSKEILDIADFVIGTGRSLMEAASKRKVLLTPVKLRKYPSIVNEKTFFNFFTTNFSERNSPFYSDDENFKIIEELINKSNTYTENTTWSYSKYTKYFNLENVVEKYLTLYNDIYRDTCKTHHILKNSLDFIFHFIKVHKNIITHFKYKYKNL